MNQNEEKGNWRYKVRDLVLKEKGANVTQDFDTFCMVELAVLAHYKLYRAVWKKEGCDNIDDMYRMEIINLDTSETILVNEQYYITHNNFGDKK